MHEIYRRRWFGRSPNFSAYAAAARNTVFLGISLGFTAAIVCCLTMFIKQAIQGATGLFVLQTASQQTPYVLIAGSLLGLVAVRLYDLLISIVRKGAPSCSANDTLIIATNVFLCIVSGIVFGTIENNIAAASPLSQPLSTFRSANMVALVISITSMLNNCCAIVAKRLTEADEFVNMRGRICGVVSSIAQVGVFVMVLYYANANSVPSIQEVLPSTPSVLTSTVGAAAWLSIGLSLKHAADTEAQQQQQQQQLDRYTGDMLWSNFRKPYPLGVFAVAIVVAVVMFATASSGLQTGQLLVLGFMELIAFSSFAIFSYGLHKDFIDWRTTVRTAGNGHMRAFFPLPALFVLLSGAGCVFLIANAFKNISTDSPSQEFLLAFNFVEVLMQLPVVYITTVSKQLSLAETTPNWMRKFMPALLAVMVSVNAIWIFVGCIQNNLWNYSNPILMNLAATAAVAFRIVGVWEGFRGFVSIKCMTAEETEVITDLSERLLPEPTPEVNDTSGNMDEQRMQIIQGTRRPHNVFTAVIALFCWSIALTGWDATTAAPGLFGLAHFAAQFYAICSAGFLLYVVAFCCENVAPSPNPTDPTRLFERRMATTAAYSIVACAIATFVLKAVLLKSQTGVALAADIVCLAEISVLAFLLWLCKLRGEMRLRNHDDSFFVWVGICATYLIVHNCFWLLAGTIPVSQLIPDATNTLTHFMNGVSMVFRVRAIVVCLQIFYKIKARTLINPFDLAYMELPIASAPIMDGDPTTVTSNPGAISVHVASTPADGSTPVHLQALTLFAQSAWQVWGLASLMYAGVNFCISLNGNDPFELEFMDVSQIAQCCVAILGALSCLMFLKNEKWWEWVSGAVLEWVNAPLQAFLGLLFVITTAGKWWVLDAVVGDGLASSVIVRRARVSMAQHLFSIISIGFVQIVDGIHTAPGGRRYAFAHILLATCSALVVGCANNLGLIAIVDSEQIISSIQSGAVEWICTISYLWNVSAILIAVQGWRFAVGIIYERFAKPANNEAALAAEVSATVAGSTRNCGGACRPFELYQFHIKPQKRAERSSNEWSVG